MNFNELFTQIEKMQNDSPLKALEIIDQINPDEILDYSVLAKYYSYYIINYINLGDFEQALIYLDKIENILSKTDNQDILFYYHKYKGIIHSIGVSVLDMGPTVVLWCAVGI